ncbi:FAD-binding domain-containing protein [Brevundimonas sp. AJA228-03]|uniref:FAD-binding domain-containing protein n=1 Tax=Brevundimonas sp. AJA228-03 TaxID=2752515 RepID=UPI001ADF4766|nr:FAD-binding domain-containing protein [Brevundimonas sp. AJA228-03]
MPDPLDRFPPSRAAGLRRLADFVPHAGEAYGMGRNTDAGPEGQQAVSGLSPWLRHRLVTEHEVIASVLGYHDPHAARRFVQEVLWRSYWKGWLQMNPEVWTRFLTERDAPLSSDLARAVAAAEAGATGIEGLDDWAQELVQTGYLHNHARMWFASIWIFTLGLPWALGAEFFLRHLLDGDPASNTLSWRWVAGLQTVGKTYLATTENIERFTNDRFRPQGLATRALPLVEAPLPAARPLAPLKQSPSPGRSLLLVTGEDLSPESALPAGWRPEVVVIAVSGDPQSPWPKGKAAARFAAAAVEDAATRCAAHFDRPCVVASSLMSDAVLKMARDAETDQVVVLEAPVGPVADAVVQLETVLMGQGIALTRVRRSWDDRLWPLATKGFFKFKERAPAALIAEGLRI